MSATPAQPQKFETLTIHAGQTPDSDAGSRALPIHQTTSFVFPSAESAADRFALAEAGPIYSRINNPTQGAVEDRVAALEGGAAGLLVASGQSAITLSILNLAGAGDSVAVSPSLYGGSYNLFKHTLSRLGITPQWVEDPTDPASWRAAADETTRAFFVESIPNPKQDIPDLRAIADVAHEIGVPLVVDNTVATPFLLRPLEHGADVVVHSATKFLGGHGTSIAGVIVDGDSFDFAAHAEKYPHFNEPDESYNGLVFAGLPAAFATRARTNLLRDLGPAVSPFNAFLIGQGLETLPLRMERHLSNARTVADTLEADDRVASVTWASLDSSPYKATADKYLPKGAGSVLGFVLPGGLEAGRRFVDALTLHSHVANIGDVRSLVIHPASTTHSQLSEDEQRAAGIEPGFVRLSVGIEHIDDILADIEQGLVAAS
ncbi:O-acetylhomoserine aminocarboxypropyltransferase/cysteine synthase family protein [Brachybacterium tyrofermentans]|uniref:O-acetylhomoserine aminocarboxypropyltransferase/cysteine synthase family protein n=1 Tax=Brachybacterium tyrofermentans TaxID=47848 RepID=A0ABW0FG45_9MICO|nr:PLP-dependent transferase [Brachybacterium tyrofermentans]SLN05162.1 O-acetylhomoserine sulfhydrylase / O-succinylhomoserine sulfhydrylase [Corynebacterium xerosis]